MACTVYSEQVGECRHVPGKKGEISHWYNRTGSINRSFNQWLNVFNRVFTIRNLCTINLAECLYCFGIFRFCRYRNRLQ